MTNRCTPHNEEAEKATLGSCLIAPAFALDEVNEKLDADAFFIPKHRLIYETICALRDKGAPVDLVSLTTALHDADRLEESGGASYLAELFGFVPTASNVGYYIQLLLESGKLRKLLSVCKTFEDRVYEEPDKAGKLVSEFESAALLVNNEREESREEAKDYVHDIIDWLTNSTGNTEPTGLRTGLHNLDRLVDGLHPGEMFVLAARPSVGKTAIALNIVEHVALNLALPVGVFSLEMTTPQLLQRMAISRSGVPINALRFGAVSERQTQSLTDVATEIHGSRMFICDTAGMTISQIASKARRWKRKAGLSLIVIDYLQLIVGTSKRSSENRQNEITEISAAIKRLAKELEIPIIALAQLNRNSEYRTGKQAGRPRLADLRESGSIEQDADTVALLSRPEMYEHDEEKRDAIKGVAILDIAKQRNGPTGELRFKFERELFRFTPDESKQESE